MFFNTKIEAKHQVSISYNHFLLFPHTLVWVTLIYCHQHNGKLRLSLVNYTVDRCLGNA